MIRALTELAAILAFFTLLLVVAPKQASEGASRRASPLRQAQSGRGEVQNQPKNSSTTED